MYQIKDVKFRRLAEVDGVPCAEVEVHPGNEGDKPLLVYIARSNLGQGYDLMRIVRSDANLVTDWYDNNYHTAFEDVTSEAFESSNVTTADAEEELFKQNLLAFGDLTSVLAKRLG
ncbi:hypothetical protein PASE110613_15710 [Paenibacillus sediminis]|uniref:Uncharacterized protein n=1 Tax=Paenibacillus sediminis TaxID=664909 RepID=A0ABS4H6W6_9BACL|nr:hypothetical protein [Paenibacillus sediminis]MBP1938285.1 hypothetical protein [Paenibacillus sediminis]